MKKAILITVILLTIGLLPLFIWSDNIGFFDFLSQQVPFILETKRLIATGTPWWSWNTFSGTNFIGGYVFYTLTSPFVWLICLFPASKIIFGMIFCLYLKLSLTSAFAYLYFRKMDLSDIPSVVGSILYTFSSFYLCSLYYFHFCEPFMLFPLLLIVLEKVINKERRALMYLVLISFAIVFINYYFSFSSFLLGLLYFVFRAREKGNLSFSILCKSVGCVLLGILMASFVLLPSIMSAMGSGRASNFYILGFKINGIIPVLSHYLPWLRSMIMPRISEEVPMDGIIDLPPHFSNEPFITLFGLLPVAIYAYKKRNWLAWIIAILIFAYFTPLNGLFALYTKPLYSRWLYGWVLFASLASLYVVKDRIKISKKAFVVYIAVCAIILGFNLGFSWFVNLKNGISTELSHIRYIELALLVVNLICLGVWVYNRENQKQLLWLVSICSACLAFASGYSYTTEVMPIPDSNRVNLRKLVFDADYAERVSPMEYRHDDLTSYLNISMLQDRAPVFGFHSIYPKSMSSFRYANDSTYIMPKFEPTRRTANRTSIATLMSVKEVRDYKDSIRGSLYDRGMTKIGSDEDYETYKFDYYIPMGYSYDSYVLESDIKALLDSADVALLLLDNLSIKESDEAELSRLLARGRVDKNVCLDSLFRVRSEFTATNFIGDSKGFSASTDFKEERVLFFSVANDPGFTAKIDGVSTKIYEANLGMMAIVVPPGPHTIEFSYFPPGLVAGIILSAIGLIIFFGIFFFKKQPEGCPRD